MGCGQRERQEARGHSAVGGVCTNWANQNDECSLVSRWRMHQHSNASESAASTLDRPECLVRVEVLEVSGSSSDGGLGSVWGSVAASGC